VPVSASAGAVAETGFHSQKVKLLHGVQGGDATATDMLETAGSTTNALKMNMNLHLVFRIQSISLRSKNCLKEV